LFIGGQQGPWRVTQTMPMCGVGLANVPTLQVVQAPKQSLAHQGGWLLQGFTSNVCYAERHEITQLKAQQELWARWMLSKTTIEMAEGLA